MSRQPKQPKQPEPLQTIDPTALGRVAGGAARAPAASGGGADSDVLAALTGIQESLASLANNNSGGGFGGMEMMMFAMLMAGRNQGPVAVAPQNPYAGYTVDGVFYPFK